MFGGTALLKPIRFSGAFTAPRAMWTVRQIDANLAAALQIGGRSYAPLAANFLAVLCGKSARSLENWRWAFEGEKGRFYEGKIKEDGTMTGRFWKLSLSAHCLGGPRLAPYFLAPRAVISRKALALLGFERHQRRKSPGFRSFSA